MRTASLLLGLLGGASAHVSLVLGEQVHAISLKVQDVAGKKIEQKIVRPLLKKHLNLDGWMNGDRGVGGWWKRGERFERGECIMCRRT